MKFIKDKILHVLRNYCGYYELEKLSNILYSEQRFYIEKTNNLDIKVQCKILKYDKLLAKHEAKILEYDILFAKNESNILERDILDNKIKEFPNLYKKYLVAELEEILNIMKDKGIHPQDLIKRIINKANRDIKE